MSFRRRHPRAPLRTLTWIGQDGIFTCTPQVLRDLSERGALIETPQVFGKGGILSLRFQLPGSTRLISVTAIVRNSDTPTLMGVEFLDLAGDDAAELRAFVGEAASQVA